MSHRGAFITLRCVNVCARIVSRAHSDTVDWQPPRRELAAAVASSSCTSGAFVHAPAAVGGCTRATAAHWRVNSYVLKRTATAHTRVRTVLQRIFGKNLTPVDERIGQVMMSLDVVAAVKVLQRTSTMLLYKKGSLLVRISLSSFLVMMKTLLTCVRRSELCVRARMAGWQMLRSWLAAMMMTTTTTTTTTMYQHVARRCCDRARRRCCALCALIWCVCVRECRLLITSQRLSQPATVAEMVKAVSDTLGTDVVRWRDVIDVIERTDDSKIATRGTCVRVCVCVCVWVCVCVCVCVCVWVARALTRVAQ
jgi:hypothetical protein